MTQSATNPAFPWDVASGDPTASSVVLWTRLHCVSGHSTSRPEVGWEMWASAQVSMHPVISGVELAEADGTVRVEASGLAPGQRYFYRFHFGEESSATGSTATLDRDSESVSIGIACCARLASGPLTAYEGLRLAEPDLVIHLGDYIYEDGGHSGDEGPVPEPPWECRTFDDYSARYAQYRSDPNLRGLHRCVPWFVLPDDHEITDDAFPPEQQASNPPVDPPTFKRRTEALAAHDRWMPFAEQGNGPTRFDRHVPLGRIADLILIDTRHGGRQQPAGTGPTAVQEETTADRSSQRSILSDAQWAWLDQMIGATERPWLVLASQVQVAPLRLGWLPRWSWPPRLRTVVNPDQWDGYPADRDRLVELLDRHAVDQVLVLSGDLHARFVTTFERSAGLRIGEVTTPSVTAPTFASLIQRRLPLPSGWRAWRLVARWLRRINPNILDMDLAQHGTTLVEIDAESVIITELTPAGKALRRWKSTGDRIERIPPEERRPQES